MRSIHALVISPGCGGDDQKGTQVDGPPLDRDPSLEEVLVVLEDTCWGRASRTLDGGGNERELRATFLSLALTTSSHLESQSSRSNGSCRASDGSSWEASAPLVASGRCRQSTHYGCSGVLA